MRQPVEIERLYLDFDGFFASVHQQCTPSLRGRPVGVVPYKSARTCIIACSKEAKARGVGNVMPLAEALLLCPDLVLVPQRPDLYRRAHDTLIAEIESVIPVDAVKSIDELTCKIDGEGRRNPRDLAKRIKATLKEGVGEHITCSIGMAANRQLAKIACKVDKPNGVTIWHPRDLPGPLYRIPLEGIPGVGRRMAIRLAKAGITTTQELCEAQPKRVRKIWNSVNGERLWLALKGYDIQAPPAERSMFGHARVLPPDGRTPAAARENARLLLTKAARRLRRAGYYCSTMWLWLQLGDDGGWSDELTLPAVHDDQALLTGLSTMWKRFKVVHPKPRVILRVGVTLLDITPVSERQLDFLTDDDAERQRWERITTAIDALNARYSATVASIGPWRPPAGGNVGGKISFTRIPSAEDFW